MAEHPECPRIVLIFGLAAFTMLILGTLPIAAANFGYQFLPSVQWVDQTALAAVILGGIVALPTPFALLKSMKRQPPKHGLVMRSLIILVSPLLVFWTLSIFFTVGIPAAVAIAAGTETRAEYTVTSIRMSNSRNCGNPVKIGNMPFLWDKLCNVPTGFAQDLKRGSRVTAEGRGTQLGLFVSSLRQQN